MIVHLMTGPVIHPQDLIFFIILSLKKPNLKWRRSSIFDDKKRQITYNKNKARSNMFAKGNCRMIMIVWHPLRSL